MTDHITENELRFERHLAAPIDKVWRYLTEPELRAKWFMAGPTDLEVGGKFGLTMDHDRLSDETVDTPQRYCRAKGHSWAERIIRLEPPRLLAFTWDNGDAGEVTFELSTDGAGTRLVLFHSGLRGREDALQFGGGWHAHLAALERRIRDEGVANFWALHAEAERKMEQALDEGR